MNPDDSNRPYTRTDFHAFRTDFHCFHIFYTRFHFAICSSNFRSKPAHVSPPLSMHCDSCWCILKDRIVLDTSGSRISCTLTSLYIQDLYILNFEVHCSPPYASVGMNNVSIESRTAANDYDVLLSSIAIVDDLKADIIQYSSFWLTPQLKMYSQRHNTAQLVKCIWLDASFVWLRCKPMNTAKIGNQR